jgi:hypothetical protein
MEMVEEVVVQLEMAKIRVDGDTQTRAEINSWAVEEFAESIKQGADFPPVVVFHDEEGNYWLSSGFHRYFAHLHNRARFINASVRKGTVRDARLFSAGSNITHGMRRTNEDKQYAIRLILKDPEWGKWSASKIGEHCGVSHTTVNTIRNELKAAAKILKTSQENNGADEEASTDTEDESAQDKPAYERARSSSYTPPPAGTAWPKRPRRRLHPEDIAKLKTQISRSVPKLLRQCLDAGIHPVTALKDYAPSWANDYEW